MLALAMNGGLPGGAAGMMGAAATVAPRNPRRGGRRGVVSRGAAKSPIARRNRRRNQAARIAQALHTVLMTLNIR